MRRLLAFFISLGLLATTQAFVHAQTAGYAELSGINAEDFPQVSALLDVYDANGEFISGLHPADLAVYEDSTPREVDPQMEGGVTRDQR